MFGFRDMFRNWLVTSCTMASLGSRRYIWNIISISSLMVASRYFSRALRSVSLTCIRSRSMVSVLWLRNSPPKLASTGDGVAHGAAR